MDDLSALKVLIKKIFPPDKCVFTVDSNGDGSPDALLIRALNVVFPFEIPEEISIDKLDGKTIKDENFDVGTVLQIYLDDKQIDLSKQDIDTDTIQERFLLIHNNEKFSFLDIFDGNLSGRTIALGDKIDILLRMDKSHFERLTEGDHKFKIKSELFPTLKVNFTMNKDNFNIKYPLDPSKTE